MGPFEILFRLLAWGLLVFFEPETTHKLFIIIINIIVLISFYKFFDNKFYSIVSLLVYLHTPFLSISSNILRQSLALSLILLTFTIKKTLVQKLLLILIPFIHASSWPIVLYLLLKEAISQKLLIIIYLLSIVLFLTSTNVLIFGGFELLSDYNNIETFTAYGAGGNRKDFFAATLFLTLISIFLYKKDIISAYFINYLLAASSYFYMMGFQAFSDRYAIYVWYFIPIIFTHVLIIILEKRGIKKNESFN